MSRWTGIAPFQWRCALLLSLFWLMGAWNVLLGVFILEPDSEGLILLTDTVRGSFIPLPVVDGTNFSQPGIDNRAAETAEIRAKLGLATTLLFLGWMLGSTAWSTLADHYGRRPVACVNSAALALTILLESQAPTLELFLLSRFLLGVTVGGCGVISYVWGTEWANYHVQLSPPEFETGTAIDKVRAAAVGGTIFQILWSIGGVVLPLLAWMVPFWRTSLLIICIATAVGGTVVLLAVPESPKWLQSKHRTYQLTKLDSMIRQFNSARLSRREWRRLSDDDAVAVDYCGDDTSKIRGKDDDELASVAEEFSIEIEAEEKPIDEENDERPTDKTFAIRQALLPLRQLLSRRMLPTTIAFAVLWFANAFLYYGLVLNVNRLPGNVYVVSSLMSLLCIPGQLLSVTASKRLGVRRALIWGMAIVGGLFGMLAMLTVFSLSLGSGADWLPLLSIAISLVGQFIVNMTFTLCYRITAQTFPTAIRSTAVGLCVMAGRVGAMLCPVVVLLGSDSTHSSGGGSMGVAGLSILALVSCLATATFSRFASDSAPSAGD